MPVALSQRGPFSEEKYTLNDTTAGDTVSARTFSLGGAVFIPTLPETIEVLIDGVKLKGDGLQITAGSGDEFYVNSATNPTTVTIETNSRLNTIADSTITALASGNLLVIRRISNRSSKNVDYAPGSVIREIDLDNSNIQILHVAQEAMDIALAGMVLDADDEFNSQGKVIKSVANPVSDNDAVNKTYLEDTWLTATDKTNSATVAGISSEVATVAGDSTEITTLVNGTDGTSGTGGTTKNIALVNTVALRTAEVGLLGTSAMATASTGHLALLGTSAMANTTNGYLKVLGNTTVTDDMALLGADGVITDMAQLTAPGVVAAMALLAGNSASGNTVIEDMNTLATSDIVANLDTLATLDIVADLAVVGAAGVVGDLETVADNINSINDFADKYRIASSAPSSNNDDGDLYYNTGTDQLNVYDGSAWTSIGLTQAQTTVTADNSATAMAIALG